MKLNLALLQLGGLLLCSSMSVGCISLAVYGHSGGQLLDTSHKADDVLSAHQLPDRNIVVFVKGRLTEEQGPAEFSLLVPYSELAKAKDKCRRPELRLGCLADPYEASIGPPPEYKMSDWAPLDVQHNTDKEMKAHSRLSPNAKPVINVLEISDSSSAGADLRKKWGNIEIVYTESYEDGTAFWWKLKPKAERIEKKRSLMWLPVTVPLDVVTLPVQALWGALFVLSSGAK